MVTDPNMAPSGRPAANPGGIGTRALLVWSLVAMALDIGVSRITYGTILPALSRDLGLDYLTGGLLGAANLAAYLVGTLLAPSLGRRTGMRAMARWGHLAFAFGAVLCGIAPGVAVLALGRLVMGLGSGMGLLAVFVLVFAAVPPGRRPLASAFVWSGIGVAILLSGLAVPWLLAPGGAWRLSFLLPAIVGIAVGLAVGRPAAQPENAPASPVPAQGRAPLWAHWPLAAAYFAFGVGYIAYATFVGTKLAAEAASTAAVAAFWLTFGAAATVGSACTALLLSAGKLRRIALVAALATAALGSLAAGHGGAAAAVLAAVLVGLGLPAVPTIVTAYARERTSDADYPRVFSFATAGLGLGQLLGPVVAGLLAGPFGSDAVMDLAALAYGIGTAIALLDLLRTASPTQPTGPGR